MSDVVALGSTYSYLQKYIDLTRKMDEKAFCNRVVAPVLISEERRKPLSFATGSTRHVQARRDQYLPCHLIENAHKLPVYELRQKTSEATDRVFLGRSPENSDVVISDETVSLRQCVFHLDRDSRRYSIEDLESRNGTLVNGVRLEVRQKLELTDGDTVAFGELRYLFYYPAGLFGVLKARMTSP
jgi:hypothetical protein